MSRLLGQGVRGLEGASIVFGARLPLFLVETLKSKAQGLAAGGAETQWKAGLNVVALALSPVSFSLHGMRLKSQWKPVLLASVEGAEARNQLSHPSLLPMTCLFSCREEKILSLLS